MIVCFYDKKRQRFKAIVQKGSRIFAKLVPGVAKKIPGFQSEAGKCYGKIISQLMNSYY
jgi:hypothetical protein